MFGLFNSKKGFTLVELMIVVVIMAILVAVAVPVYSAVTENARAKTCIGNQREILSVLTNWLMLHQKTAAEGSFEISNNDGEGAFGNLNAAVDISEDEYTEIKGSFKMIPFCPATEGVVKVTISKPDADNKEGFSTCKTECSVAKHILPTE